MTTEFILTLPYSSPPLSLNHRRHWRATANLTRAVRDATHVLAREARIGRHDRVRVTLHYRPRDKRVRDSENPTPTLKACCDGLVDAGIVSDDSPQFMVKDMPVIHEPRSPARLWLVVAPLPAEPTAPGVLCACGCGQPAPIARKTSTANGVRAGQQLRFVHGHHNRTRPERLQP